MKARYKWAVSGFLAGSLFSFMQLVLIYRKLGLLESIDPFAVWQRPVGPIVLAVAAFFIGLSREKLVKHQQETEHKNSELQKAMIDQSMNLGAELNRVMDQLNRYTDQLDKIVNNINAGVCVINREYKIEEGFNNSFVSVFGNKDYLGNSIIGTVFAMLNDGQRKEVEEFIEQCFVNSTASDSMLSDANPVEAFDYLYMDGGSAVQKFIKTRVVRLKDKNGEVEKLMFLFDDVTSTRELEQSIVRKEKEYNKKYGIVVSILGNDREITRNFIDDLENDLKNIGEGIKRLKQNKTNTDLIAEIIGMVHSVKGESFSLEFKTLAKQAADFEKYLKGIKGSAVDLEANLEIVNFFEKMSNEHRELNKIIEELASFIYGRKEPEGQVSADIDKAILEYNVKKHLSMEEETRDVLLLSRELANVASKTAVEKGKLVDFVFNSEVDKISVAVYRNLKEALLHLVRNSVDHGIEPPEERKQNGKSEKGTISVRITKADRGIVIEYSDDGRGFDIGKIRDKALKSKLVDAEDIENMKNRDIIRLIFRDGFSTSSGVDMVSGMGVGMAVVKRKVTNQLKGRLGVTNKTDKGVSFRISIPC